EVQRTLVVLIFSGVLERFPELKIVSAENEVGWLPFFLQKLDQAHEEYRYLYPVPLKLKPREYFRRQVFATFIDDAVGVAGREFSGVDKIMWSSDYPRAVSTWPHSREVVERDFKGVPEGERRAIVRDNVARLYRLGLDCRMATITHTPGSRGAGTPRSYPDLHDHIDALRTAGLLVVVDRPINKDTEMHPLVRWQFRGGIREQDRKAFLFTNVTDSKGRTFDIPVLVCGLAGNRAIYSLDMRCPIDETRDPWIRPMTHPIPPHLVETAPCHQIVYTGADLTSGHGLDDIPVPISTPGWDNAPYTTSS